MADDDDRTASRVAHSIDFSAHPVMVKGGYQILPVQSPDSVDGPPAYVVATLLGQPLRQELSLDEARFLLDRLAEDEVRANPNAQSTRRARIKR